MKIEVVKENEFSHPTMGINLTVIFDDEGNRWFIAKEICEGLEIQNVSAAVKTLRSEDKATIVLPGGNMKKTLITKTGMRALCFKSIKPEADVFRYWLIDDVCSSLEKKGYYVADSDAKILVGFEGRASKLQLEHEKVKPAVDMLLTIQRNIKELKKLALDNIAEANPDYDIIKSFDAFKGI